MRLAIATALALATCVLAPGAHAQQVYKWKDANGATRYTQTPPPKGAYTVKAVQKGPPAPAAKPALPAEPAQCATARNNVLMLQGKNTVQMDSDGDGKPDRVLGDEDRANQLALAQATLKANNCAAK